MQILDPTLKIEIPEVAIFDWDNTLVNAWPLIYKALRDTFLHFGKKPWSYEETKINVHRALRETFPKWFPNNWQEAAKYYRIAYAKYMSLLEPEEDAEKVLVALKTHGTKVALVSNKKFDLLNEEIKLLGWHKYFQSIIGSGDLDVDKPHPKTIEVSLKNLGVPNSKNIWFVGDSVSDMEVAYAAEILPVYYGPEDYDNERFQHCYPKLHIKNYNSFISFIEGKDDYPPKFQQN